MITTTTLGEVAEYINGIAFKPTDWTSKGRRIVRIQNLTDKTKPYNRTERVVEKKYEINKGDILVSWSASLGVFTWEDEEQSLLNQHIFKVVPNENVVDKKYLLHALNNALDDMEQHLHGATMKHINRGEFLSTQIYFPPLEEQNHIAAILDKADAIRHKRQQAIDLTDQLLRSVFLEMFGDPVTNPKGLTTAYLNEVGEIVTGNTPSRKKPEYYGSHIEWIKSDNINTPDHYLTTASEFLSEDGLRVGRYVPKNSILITCIAGSHECIGNVAIANRTVAFNQQINAIVPNNKILPLFLYAQLWINKKLVQRASTESMKGMVSKSKFSKIKILLPSLLEQEKYADFFLRSLNSIKFLNTSKELSNELFKGLTQQAFRGELSKLIGYA